MTQFHRRLRIFARIAFGIEPRRFLHAFSREAVSSDLSAPTLLCDAISVVSISVSIIKSRLAFTVAHVENSALKDRYPITNQLQVPLILIKMQ
jgi:uncharacterized membrane protein YwaF